MPRKPPKWAEDVCASFGKDPTYEKQKYRVVWGPDREEIRYGKLCKRYDDVEPRWILEVFVPHSVFGNWDEESMGPKPSGGEYWLSHLIQIDGQYVALGDYGRETLKLLITCVERGKDLSAWKKESWRQEQMEKRKQAESQKFSDIYDEATGPFDENAVSGIPGKKTSADMKLLDPSMLSPELRKRLAHTAGQITQL